MNRKLWLYSGLLLLVLVLVAVGVWLALYPENPVKIPETDPWIVMDTVRIEYGIQSQISIYNDGTVIRWEDTGLPGSLSPSDPPERIWRTGKLDSGEMDDLSEFLDIIDFDGLEEYYLSQAVSANDTVVITDNFYRISVDNEHTVTAHGYIQPPWSSTYYPLPDPLHELKEELDAIIENSTEEVLTEEITPD